MSEIVRPSYVNKRFKEEIEKENINYSKNLLYFAKTGYLRVRNNFDLFMACTGWEGTGKSNLLNTLGFLMDEHYDLKRNVLYSPDIKEIKEKMEWRKLIAKGIKPGPNALPPFSFINVDEAIKVLFKLEQWSGLQRFLKKLFALARIENKIVAFAIPKFTDMGNNFRSRMNYWVDVYYRDDKLAYATVDIQSQNKYRSDNWNMSSNEKLYENMVGKRKYADIRPDDHLGICARTQNFLTSLDVPLLPKVFRDEYERLKLEHDYDDATIEVKKEKGRVLINRLKKHLTNTLKYVIELNPRISQRELGRKTGLNHGFISDLMKEAKEEECRS